jgi:DNA (cytosine-5)-methyltransferase 1
MAQGGAGWAPPSCPVSEECSLPLDTKRAQAVAIPSTGDVSHCLNAGGMGRQDYETETLIAHSLRAEGFDASEDGTGRGTPLVPVAFAHQQGGSVDLHMASDMGLTLQKSQTQAVCFNLRGREDGAQPEVDPDNLASIRAASGGLSRSYVADTLTSNGDAHSGYRDEKGLVNHASAVRRLTPRECERLQGFPDDYTAVPYRGKPAADGPRYKALGNSMAVPVMRWIGERIAAVEALSEQRSEAA